MRRRLGRNLATAAIAAGCLVPLLSSARGASALNGNGAVDLGVTLSTPATLVTDSTNVTFTVAVTNYDATDDALGITVAVALPAGYVAVSDTGGGAYAAGVWTVPGTLAANGGTSSLAIVATVPSNSDGQTATATAAITAATPATAADPVPGNNTASLTLTSRIDDLCALASTTDLPGRPALPIWTYVAGDCTTVPAAPLAPVGPTIVANEGDAVTIRLHNGLAEASSLFLQGQTMVPDTVGAPAGTLASPGLATYTFTAGAPGTFLYEAGQLPNGARQTAMGMHGALVVRSAAAGRAYATPESAFDDEAVVVVSDVDPAMNLAPTTFDLRGFVSKYTLLNGKAYPSTTSVSTAAGHRLLLRYLNAGAMPHTIGTLGVRQLLVGNDGAALQFPFEVVSDTYGPGTTRDAVVTIPAGTAVGTKYALYETNLALHNGAQVGSFGGAVTTIEVTASAAALPTVSGLAASPTGFDATFSAGSSATLTAAEYFLDTAPGAPGSGTPIAGVTGATTTLTVTFPAAVTTPGTHVVHVRAQDDSTVGGAWGPLSTTTFTIAATDVAAPAVSSVVLTPNPATTATPSIALTAIASDALTGGSAIATAEYTLDGGMPVAMTVVPNGADATLSATIPGNLVIGNHTVTVRARDGAGNWSTTVSTPLVVTSPVDSVAPVTSTVTGVPNLAVNAVRVTASVSDATTGGSNITAAEGYLDGLTTPVVFLATDGTFNSPTETVYGDFPLGSLTTGSHLFRVRGRDAAGNWSVLAQTTVVVERTAPTVGAVTVNPTVTNASTITVTAPASDVATGNSAIVSGELFIDTVGALGAGIPMGVTLPTTPSSTLMGSVGGAVLSTLGAGTHTVHVRALDAFGSWSTTVSRTFTIDRTAPTIGSAQLSPSAVIGNVAMTTTLTVTGAADLGGAGLAGTGEYWIDGAPAPGAATSFVLPAVTFPTDALSLGNHIVGVRVKDAAGNWSAITNVNLNVLANSIFTNGFETGPAPWGWASRSTNTANRLNALAAAAIEGVAGLQARGDNTNYVQYNFGTVTAATTYDARFFLRTNNTTSNGKDIFVGSTTTGYGNQTRFRVRYRNTTGTPQVQIQIGTGNTNGNWVNLLGGAASNTIEVVYQATGAGAPNPGTLQLYVNGVSVQSLTHTSNQPIASVRLGSVTAAGGTTYLHFDGFVSKRSTTPLIGG